MEGNDGELTMCGRFTYAKEFRDIRIRFDIDRDIPLFRVPASELAPQRSARMHQTGTRISIIASPQ